MQKFSDYLEKTGEIGFVEKVFHSIVYVSGLPETRSYEVLVFENGDIGQVLSLNQDLVEVLLLSGSRPRVGTKVARTGELLQVGVGKGLLGMTVDALGRSYSKNVPVKKSLLEMRPIDITPPTILNRKNIEKPLETGVSWVDLVVPLGKGQRELVIGDRKIGKTEFLFQTILSSAKSGMTCVYGGIAKRRLDIKLVEEFIRKNAIESSVVIVTSSASDPAGLTFLVPYTAMTFAEYYRDIGSDVLLILDDMTAHAKYYREISLLGRRFPGRNSYPGDIFYVQSRLLERAGNFTRIHKKEDGTLERFENSITCLPVAELVLGDISGYIQTNLMAVTDGHILFDKDYFNQGRRPAINPFLSVTRVGHQTQQPLLRDISRELSSFLVQLEKLRQYMHFGAELSEATRRTLALGDQILALLEQSSEEIIPVNANIVILGSLWAGFWRDRKPEELKEGARKIISAYQGDKEFKGVVDSILTKATTFLELIDLVKKQEQTIWGVAEVQTKHG